MIYPYRCPNCGGKDIIKSHKEAGKIEYCDQCGAVMVRIWTVPQITTQDVYTGYNPGLGAHIKNKGHLKEVLSQREGETGEKMIEVGNEKTACIIKKKNIDLGLNNAEMRKASEILQSVSE
jgi:transcription initiation factor TFIIIB Brf1 subunit/transcription initiation factor TFIIB